LIQKIRELKSRGKNFEEIYHKEEVNENKRYMSLDIFINQKKLIRSPSRPDMIS